MNIAKMPVVIAGVAALSLGNWGCATKKHVREAIAPVQNQVNEVQKRGADNKQAIGDNKQAIGDLDRQVSAADEKATDAGKRATDAAAAAGKANDAAMQAGQRADGARTMADQTSAALRGVVDNIDNYKLLDTHKVYFKFGKSTLTKEEQASLDDMVKNLTNSKNVVIEVEGYTDRVGSKNYNLTLSQKRADAVVRYLAGHEVSLRRIHQLGVGELTNSESRRAANKEDRRVDVRVFALDLKTTGSLQSSSAQVNP